MTPIGADDFIKMFEDESTTLPAVVVRNVDEGNGNGNGKELAPTSPDDDPEWQNDPVPVKLEKIKAAFLNSKSALEIEAQASIMPVGDWLDIAMKMTKQPEHGGIRITSIRVELPPRDMYNRGSVVEVDVP